MKLSRILSTLALGTVVVLGSAACDDDTAPTADDTTSSSADATSPEPETEETATETEGGDAASGGSDIDHYCAAVDEIVKDADALTKGDTDALFALSDKITQLGKDSQEWDLSDDTARATECANRLSEVSGTIAAKS